MRPDFNCILSQLLESNLSLEAIYISVCPISKGWYRDDIPVTEPP